MRRAVVAAVVVTTVLAVGQTSDAWAAWKSVGTAGANVGAQSIKKPAAPTIVKSGANAAISWTATTLTDNTTAVSGYSIVRHNGATTTTVCTTTAPTVTCNDTSPLVGTVTYGVIANYKTNWVSAESNTTTFAMDTVAPVTTGSWSGTKTNGWVKGTTSTVTLTSTDTGGSGVASITYQVGNAAPVTVNSASASFAVNAQGATTVTYHATDNAGNVEADQTLVVQLDNVAPTAAMTFPTANGPFTAATWGTNCRDASNNQIAGICGTTTDLASGTDTVQYRLTRSVFFDIFTQCWNGSAWTFNSCSTWRTAADGPTPGSWVIPITFSQLGTDGPYKLDIQATDVATNVYTSTPFDTWN